jgi:hypothetical protein
MGSHPTKEGTMITKIAITTALCASAAYLIYAGFLEVPVDTPAATIRQSHIASPERPPATRLESVGQAVIANDGTETVLGLRVRKDRKCRVELKDYVTTDGEMFSAYSCTPNKASPPHIYADYDHATLAAMAYADADAAALLGQRLIDRDSRRSYQLLVRASALDGGNVQHLAWLSDQAFGAVEINGRPQVGTLKRQYELAALGARLGDDPGKADYLKSELIRVGVADEQLNSLDLRVSALLRSMRDIQRTVLGEVTIGGQDDA